jgi:hypothetical protein
MEAVKKIQAQEPDISHWSFGKLLTQKSFGLGVDADFFS